MIANDQVGFVNRGLVGDNMRKLMHAFYYANQSTNPAVAVSLDDKKAFDHVEWIYLKEFGFGPNIINYISLLYSSPNLMVYKNGVLSSTFPLYRGTRQGCPLSPILFIPFLEPLACLIRGEEIIQGVNMKDLIVKMYFYADDILLIVQNPEISLKQPLM